MTDMYKCEVCGHTAEMMGEHCGKPMVKQDASATEPATPAPQPTAETTPAEQAPTAEQSATEQPPAGTNPQ